MNKNNPFIPVKRGNVVIVDGRMNENMIKKFENLNIKVIKTIKCEEILEPISYHPDMVIHPIDYKTIIVAPNVFDYYEEIFSKLGINVIRGEKKLSRNYPEDIAYNVGRVYGYGIHNFKYTDEKLLFYLKKQGVELIEVEQGYSKCSMAIVDEKAIITSDYPIYEKLSSLGFDVLLIKQGYIELEGFNYGFIGGSCGNISRKDIVFTGKLDTHPDREKIYDFLKKYEKNVILLSNEKIKDIGTIISLYC